MSINLYKKEVLWITGVIAGLGIKEILSIIPVVVDLYHLLITFYYLLIVAAFISLLLKYYFGCNYYFNVFYESELKKKLENKDNDSDLVKLFITDFIFALCHFAIITIIALTASKYINANYEDETNIRLSIFILFTLVYLWDFIWYCISYCISYFFENRHIRLISKKYFNHLLVENSNKELKITRLKKIENWKTADLKLFYTISLLLFLNLSLFEFDFLFIEVVILFIILISSLLELIFLIAGKEESSPPIDILINVINKNLKPSLSVINVWINILKKYFIPLLPILVMHCIALLGYLMIILISISA